MKTILSYLFFCWAMVSFSLPASAQQWTSAFRFGGTSTGFTDAAKAVCTDASGNVYITGSFNSTINFGNGTASLTATAPGTATEGFVAKFNSAGLCQWSMRFGGAATDLGGLGIVTDGTNVYVTGQSQFPSTIGSTALATVGGSTDGVVFALSASTGATVWAKAFGGGSTNDQGQAICLDGSGNVYISGVFSTRTSNPTASFGTTGSFPRTVQGSMTQATSDLFVAQINASTGAFNWVSAGGAASQETPTLIFGNDNLTGSGIAFDASNNQLIVTGSFANANASYFSNGSASPSVSLTNAGQADICVLKLDLSGNFLSGFSAGGTTNDEGLGITYDASTTATYITGYFNSASIAGAISLTNSAGGFDEIFYTRFNPSTNTFPWAKNASGSASGQDAGFAIANNGAGGIYVTGRHQGTVSFPTASSPLTDVSSGADDVFMVKVDASNGNALLLGSGNGATGTDVGFGIATASGGNIWTGGTFAGGTITFSPSSPTVSVTAGTDLEIFLAEYNDPPPGITTQPSASTACAGLPVSFTVAASGGSGFTYQWQESTDAGFTSPTTLSNGGIYSNSTTATLNISDNTTVNGRFYRAIVRNAGGGSATSNGVLLTATTPTLPAANTSETHTAGTNNNIAYAASCAIISKVVPSGATPVSGNITSNVWRESSVLTFGSQPYVQRHYQVTPAAGSTATVTLYFSQAEFDNFNAAPGSTLNLPTGPADAAGKANLRISKFNSSSGDGTGLPGSYSSGASLIDPPDANIIWNASFNRWEVTFDVTGFSGFFVQTSLFVLPVNLISFSAQRVTNDIQVKWQTAGETDNDHFELERSFDGITFTFMGQRAGVNGTGIKNYEWTDAGATLSNHSKIFYRLKIVGLSGSVEYSNTVVVYLNKSNILVTGVMPNPFSDKININLDMPASGQLVVKLTDMTGRIVYREYVQAPKGFSTHTIKGLEKFTNGLYFLSAEFEGQVFSYKLKK
ncbi:MAG: T9SS type A sorting domain-containing protein [Bacteroidota bacterium]|nr:T9SS type A sorting domain-containing protein [Bacteroidota bacterium]